MTARGREKLTGGAALRVPPRMATWLLLCWGSGPFVQSLAGDLMEEYQRGRSPSWYWREVAVAVFMARTRLLRMGAWTAVDRMVAAFALIALGLGTLTWANVVKGDADVPRRQVSQIALCVVGSAGCSPAQPGSSRGRP